MQPNITGPLMRLLPLALFLVMAITAYSNTFFTLYGNPFEAEKPIPNADWEVVYRDRSGAQIEPGLTIGDLVSALRRGGSEVVMHDGEPWTKEAALPQNIRWLVGAEYAFQLIPMAGKRALVNRVISRDHFITLWSLYVADWGGGSSVLIKDGGIIEYFGVQLKLSGEEMARRSHESYYRLKRLYFEEVKEDPDILAPVWESCELVPHQCFARVRQSLE